MSVPIYRQDHLASHLLDWLRRPSIWSSAPSIVLIGDPRVDLVKGCSYFVARYGHKRVVSKLANQKSIPGDRKHYYYRRRAYVDRYTYALCVVAWDMPFAEDLQHYPTKREAAAALRAIR